MLPSLKIVSHGQYLVISVNLPSSSKVQTLSALIPERHAYTGDRVKGLESVDGLPGSADIPQSQLTVTHLRETGGCDPVMLTKPDRTAVLGTRVSLCLMRGAFLTHIPNAQLLVSRGRNQEGAVRAPGL